MWNRKKRAEEKKESSREVFGPKRPTGGQRGHKGSRMEMTATPSRVEVIPGPSACGGCGSAFMAGGTGSADGTGGFVRAQVTDLPSVTPQTVEYRMPVRHCGCGHTTIAPAPDGVQPGQASYGPGVKTMIALLAEIGHTSIERTSLLMALMFNLNVSGGFVAKVDARLSDRLAGFEEQVKEHLRRAEVAGTDETPVSLAGKTAYIYGMHDGKVVWYGAGLSRGHETIKGFDLLTGFTASWSATTMSATTSSTACSPGCSSAWPTSSVIFAGAPGGRGPRWMGRRPARRPAGGDPHRQPRHPRRGRAAGRRRDRQVPGSLPGADHGRDQTQPLPSGPGQTPGTGAGRASARMTELTA
ncbi:transposase [Nonomuraea phyllanthi]|uniref:Transposase n=1 Tax=Nonomuraea phyllanthi TaxID=2219224 RepID=A0A5C4V0R2_9ACTN|nr:transposase [Nonomuraea phyllanthi]